MAKAHIFTFDSIPPVNRGEGVTAKPLVSKAVGSTKLTNGITTFPPRRCPPAAFAQLR